MKKVYLYKRFERFWHWAQFVLITALIVTGFEIHSSFQLLGYEAAVVWHNYAALSFIVLIGFAIFWHFSTDEWQNYIPTTKNLKAQLNFYLFGIFRNAPHPTKKRVLSKLNPLQRLIYFALKILVIPVMVGSGLLYFLFHYPVGGMEVVSLRPVAILHTFGAYLLVMFLIVHLYLITTGHTLTSNLMAMITGWDRMADEDAKQIVEDAIEEVEHNILQQRGENGEKSKEVKEIILETMGEISEKQHNGKPKAEEVLVD